MEPLLLIGTDVLSENEDAEWQFCYVGLHPETRNGTLVVRGPDRKLHEIPLASWPTTANKPLKTSHPNTKKQLEAAKAKRNHRQRSAQRKQRYARKPATNKLIALL